MKAHKTRPPQSFLRISMWSGGRAWLWRLDASAVGADLKFWDIALVLGEDKRKRLRGEEFILALKTLLI